MNGFYVSWVFFGILLVLFSLICIFFDKKKAFSFIKSYADKKQELVEIMNDAEQMIEELNRFSDYIVNQMDLKNEELSKNLKSAEENIFVLSERAGIIYNKLGATTLQEANECRKSGFEMPALSLPVVQVFPVEVQAVEVQAAVAVNGEAINKAGSAATPYFKFNSDFVVAPTKKSEKVIPINNKYSEVIRLSQEGMQGLEIAKRLNMGKGEVELILGLRK